MIFKVKWNGWTCDRHNAENDVKSSEDKDDPNLSLIEYKIRKCNFILPAQMLMGRSLKSLKPIRRNLLNSEHQEHIRNSWTIREYRRNITADHMQILKN